MRISYLKSDVCSSDLVQRPITKAELIRLQQIVIDNPRFTKMGFRQQEGFIGEHDRHYGAPIPDHISARWKDLELLIDGWIETGQKLEIEHDCDAVLSAAMIAFGFRWEERRVGKECVSTFRSGWSQ